MSENTDFARNSVPNIFRFYWLSIVGIIIYVLLDVIAQSLPPHYSPIRDAESDLAVGPYGFIMAINFLNRGLLSLSFVYALSKTVKFVGGNIRAFKTGSSLIVIWGFGSAILAFFPTDVPATPMSWHGAIHFVVAIIVFIAAALGTLSLSLHMDDCEVTKGVKKVAMGIAFSVVLFWTVEFVSPFVLHHFSDSYGGLLERLFLGSVLLWILTVSIYIALGKSVSAKTDLERPVSNA